MRSSGAAAAAAAADSPPSAAAAARRAASASLLMPMIMPPTYTRPLLRVAAMSLPLVSEYHCFSPMTFSRNLRGHITAAWSCGLAKMSSRAYTRGSTAFKLLRRFQGCILGALYLRLSFAGLLSGIAVVSRRLASHSVPLPSLLSASPAPRYSWMKRTSGGTSGCAPHTVSDRPSGETGKNTWHMRHTHMSCRCQLSCAGVALDCCGSPMSVERSAASSAKATSEMSSGTEWFSSRSTATRQLRPRQACRKASWKSRAAVRSSALAR
mmetsp:Transcript_26246/g.43329  ORF Transcript_26246/g.43329 Transcript_26246/m.43329 type:complete len:267 (-) Transcript_26246:532-1332(-)